MDEATKENDRDYQYRLVVDGAELTRGDAHTIGVMFFNLSGRNWEKKSRQDYDDYLAWMAHHFGRPLTGSLELRSPEGRVLQSGVVGELAPHADAVAKPITSASPGM